jgi:hypothetical protein
MTRSVKALAVALLVMAGTRAPVRAQTSVLLGFGPTIPVGSLTDSGPFSGANTGWQGTIGLRRTVGSSGLALGARAFYGANGYEGPDGQDSSLFGLAAVATWAVARGPVSPLLWSEAGFLSHKHSADSGGLLGGAVDSSEEAFVLTGGLGIGVPIGAIELLLLGGYSHAFGVFDDITYFSLMAAMSFAIG